MKNRMKNRINSTLIVLSVALMLRTLTSAPGLAKTKTWSFDKEKVQELPSGWLSEHTGQGSKGNWKVVADATAPSQPNVLAQQSNDATNYRFPLAIVEKTNYKDVVLGVRFKAISGATDQGAGLVWRLCQQLLHRESQRPGKQRCAIQGTGRQANLAGTQGNFRKDLWRENQSSG